jgi:sugar lactone lactonase YvrE
MTEQNPGVDSASASPRSTARTISLSAAILAVPIGAAWMYATLRDAADQRDRSIEEGARYDLSALQHIDPSLIRYTEVQAINPAVPSPRAMALDVGGRLLVAGDRLVGIWTASGGRLGEIETDQPATCVAGTKDGRVLVGMRDHVEVFDATGKRIAVWPRLSADSVITGIAASGDDIYVADSGRRIVLRCTADGRIEAELGKADPSRDIPGLIAPSPHIQVAVGPDGLVWINNPGRHRMEAYTRDGELQRFFGSAGSAIEQFLGCCNPSNFAILSDGRIVTAEKGVPRVKVYSPQGALESVVAAPSQFGDNNSGLDLATDSQGRVLVLEPGLQVIRVFAPDS